MSTVISPALHINLPAGTVVSEGQAHACGATVAFMDAKGHEMATIRALRFMEDPEAAMRVFLDFLAAVIPGSTALEQGGKLIPLSGGVALHGWSDGVYFRDAEDNELVCWVAPEWQESPEEVIGAILMVVAEHFPSNRDLVLASA